MSNLAFLLTLLQAHVCYGRRGQRPAHRWLESNWLEGRKEFPKSALTNGVYPFAEAKQSSSFRSKRSMFGPLRAISMLLALEPASAFSPCCLHSAPFKRWKSVNRHAPMLNIIEGSSEGEREIEGRAAGELTNKQGRAGTVQDGGVADDTAKISSVSFDARRASPSLQWPPAAADQNAVWVEGKSAGPLGARFDAIFESRFRDALVAEMGQDAEESGFAGTIALVQSLVTKSANADEVSSAARRVLTSLFPDWPPFAPPGRVGLLYWFEILFARPLPGFSAKLNAWVTWWAAQWLMGPCELEDIDDAELAHSPGDTASKLVAGDGKGQQLRVRRCRFLEEVRCASVCVNSCKMPTQGFFNQDMGVPMRMLPDYETLECRFQFGVPPTTSDEQEARSTPCFTACPVAGERREALVRCLNMGASDGLAEADV